MLKKLGGNSPWSSAENPSTFVFFSWVKLTLYSDHISPVTHQVFEGLRNHSEELGLTWRTNTDTRENNELKNSS